MKKQILIFATAFVAVAFVSCSKETIEKQNVEVSEEIPTATQRPDPSLNKGLIGLFEFNSNLKDKTGKLADAFPTSDNSAKYTVDRKGRRGSAIKFDGTYGLAVFNVPLTIKMSLVAWVKNDSLPSVIKPMAFGTSGGPGFLQVNNEYYGFNSNNIDNYAAPAQANNEWRLLVLTMDGAVMKFYVDGNIVGTKPITNFSGLSSTYYFIGFNGSTNFWSGSMDDLRLYDRVLSSNEVQGLFNL